MTDIPINRSQGTHFYVMTLRKPMGPGASAECTISGTITPPTDWTRADLYQHIYQSITRDHPELAGASVLFFTADRNQL